MAVGGGPLPAGLNRNVHQGYFAEGFVAAIAAAAGLDVLFPRLGAQIDLSVFKPGPGGTSGSRQMTLQVKSWAEGEPASDDLFHYPLEVSAYNYLAGDGHDVRHYLVLCVVSKDTAEYAVATEPSLTLYRSAYWLSLRDKDPDPSLNVDSRKTVYVPRSHLLTVDTIKALLENREDQAVVS